MTSKSVVKVANEFVSLQSSLLRSARPVSSRRSPPESAVSSFADVMVQPLVERFGSAPEIPEPAERVSDNGSGYIAHETRAFPRDIGLMSRWMPYRSSQSNDMAEPS